MSICKADLTRSGDGEKETGDGLKECGMERERVRGETGEGRVKRVRATRRATQWVSGRESGNKLWFGNKGILVFYFMIKISPNIKGIKVFY